MTSKVSKPGAPFLPYRRILPEGFECPVPKYLREDMRQAEAERLREELRRLRGE